MSGSTGWRRDPFGLHEWRYFVDGQPTSSVGDSGLLSEDAPPGEEQRGAPVATSAGNARTGGGAAEAITEAAVPPADPTPSHPAQALGAVAPSGVVARPGDLLTVPTEVPSEAGSPPRPAEIQTLGWRAEESGIPVSVLGQWLVAALPLLGIYGVVRVGLLVADVLSAHAGYGNTLSGPLLAWDAHWYVQIAEHGYPAHPALASGALTYNAANFLPFFSILIRAVQVIGFSPVIAASIVSWLSGAVASLLVWRMGSMAFGEATGRLAAVLFMVFPGMGVAWGALYSECVGLALAAGCLLLLMRRGGGAGLLGMCATLTSPMAVVPLTAAASAALFQAWRRRESLVAPALAVVLTPAGFLGYAAWIGGRYHDLLFYWHLGHQVWGTSVDFGRSLGRVLTHPLTQGFLGPGWLNWAGLIAVIGAIVAMVVARLPAILSVYTSVVLLQLTVTNVLGFRPRNLTWAFPALISVAAVSRRRGAKPLALGFAVLLPVVFLAYTMIGNTMGAP